MPEVELPGPTDWRTDDTQELERRRLRAHDEAFDIRRIDREHPVYSNFRVQSESGLRYEVEVRDIKRRLFSCDCVDFRINGLGTCKHVEGVLLYLQATTRKVWKEALEKGSSRIDIVPDGTSLKVERNVRSLPRRLKEYCNSDGIIRLPPEEVLQICREYPSVRISQEVSPWLDRMQREQERMYLLQEYERKVQSGEWPTQETKVPLFPYQRTGMLHLAFGERALLADEMGLGKTIQAIAAAALLARLGKAERALVVTPASLKTEWEEQIRQFTHLPLHIVYGNRSARLAAYENAPFFTLVNYEQMLADTLDVNARLKPDIVILDEAQRIKNWSTKTAQAIKRLQSRYAFVLTGTPIENRIDELKSIVDFLDPTILGPLFRFNREFYQLDDRGRPSGYQNLDVLRRRIAPVLLRRRKSDVETELPARTDRFFFVTLEGNQADEYSGHANIVRQLIHIAKRRPLTQKEQEKLMRHMNIMRILCDTPYILNRRDKTCPKIRELERILEECCSDPQTKVIIFSEWQGMLELVRELCRHLKLGFAWHTGRIDQRRRRAEIQAFKTDPNCRVFLSTDSGGVGLNLQNASYVINCDLPWNPAKLEQRIARAWRKHQTRPVTVINLVAEYTIEHGLIESLGAKKELAEGILDGKGELKKITFRPGAQSFLKRLEQAMSSVTPQPANTPAPATASDVAAMFAKNCAAKLNGNLICFEERFIDGRDAALLWVVVKDGVTEAMERVKGIYRDTGVAHARDASEVRDHHLQVVTESTANAIEQLASAGMLSMKVRARRILYPEAVHQPELTDVQKQRIEECIGRAAVKCKAARVLLTAQLNEEAQSLLRESVQQMISALAIRNGWEEPGSLELCSTPPYRSLWPAEQGENLGLNSGEICGWVERQSSLERDERA